MHLSSTGAVTLVDELTRYWTKWSSISANMVALYYGIGVYLINFSIDAAPRTNLKKQRTWMWKKTTYFGFYCH